MSTILNDTELVRLFGAVIENGDTDSLRPNSYILRMGSEGEFINTGKEFVLDGKEKRGIRIPPSNSVGVTSLETINFKREVVHKIYPGCDLHGMVSPTTDLAREGIVAASTNIDAGYRGTLNWTLSNTSNEERRFMIGERLFRLEIFKLEEGETPEHLYAGDYQDQDGYVGSRRRGAPGGMKEKNWITAYEEGGPEKLLDDLMKSGYPWNILGTRLKSIDLQFKEVTEEYANIDDAIGELGREVSRLTEVGAGVSQTVRTVLRDEIGSIQDRWIIGAGAGFLGVLGILLGVISSDNVLGFINENSILFTIGLVLLSIGGFYYNSRKKRG